MRVTIDETCKLLQESHPVALPTETVYGLAARYSDERAISQVFSLKGRPSNNPLIVHISNIEDLFRLSLSQEQHLAAFVEAFWPGPLTVVLPVRQGAIPHAVRAGLNTAAFRMPAHPLTLQVIDSVGPLVMPSANLSGRPSATSPTHVFEDFGEPFPCLDGGPCRAGVESTIITLGEGGLWEILRWGALPPCELRNHLGYLPCYRADSEGELPPCPGRQHRHYAPQAELFSGGPPPLSGAIIGFDDRAYPPQCRLFSLGRSDDAAAAARRLYSALREVDAAAYATAWVDDVFPSEGDLWLTVRERLTRATASQKPNSLVKNA